MQRVVCLATVFAFFVLLAVIGWKDFKTMRIPDRMNLAVFLTGGCAIFTVPGPDIVERVFGMFAVSVPMLLVAMVTSGGFGGGDIKLAAAGGLFLGLEGNVLAVLLGLAAGGVWAAGMVLFKKAGRRDVFPFGPVSVRRNDGIICNIMHTGLILYTVKVLYDGRGQSLRVVSFAIRHGVGSDDCYESVL